ncbi:MAG: hypothetical protein ABJH21_10150 [Parasphingorhabdus sp.]|uniref:hypothetical protein n=2 Tax=Parasphingorhabdus sp. TaxID=2709688 RepID=UPI0032988C81
MSDILNAYIAQSDDVIADTFTGEGFRCSVDLSDGTHLPCVMLRRPEKTIDLALRRFKDEQSGRGVFRTMDNGYRKVVKSFVTSGNKVSSYDIESVRPSIFAIPLELLEEIQGETFMSWTGWVFEMNDGALFSFGTTFLFDFFSLPEKYNFSDVAKVHNHSYVGMDGTIASIHENRESYVQLLSSKSKQVFRERPYFKCYVDEI